MRTRLIGAGLGVVFLLGAGPHARPFRPTPVQNPSVAGGRTVWDGVYTDDQDRRGADVAKASCVTCHGDGLAGTDLAPALHGPDFVASWSGRTVAELYEKIHTTMPADGVGTLRPRQSVDLVAHILKLNGFPAGATELEPELAALNEVHIRSRK
jgi:quinoprotein glucose dehydrogenase